MLGARCEAGDTIVGSLHVYFGEDATASPARSTTPCWSCWPSYVGRLYSYRAGLPVHGDRTADQTRRQEDRDLWVAVTSHELRTPVTVIKGYADTLTNHWDSLGEDGRQEAVRVIGARAGELARLVDRLLSATSEDGEVGGVAGRAVRPGRGAAARGRGAARRPAPPAGAGRAARRAAEGVRRPRLARHHPHRAGHERGQVLAAGHRRRAARGGRRADRDVPGRRPRRRRQARSTSSGPSSGTGRASPATGGTIPGAGLGLYLVRRIVERQHGWVSLRPREGGGTVAEVRLPRG